MTLIDLLVVHSELSTVSPPGVPHLSVRAINNFRCGYESVVPQSEHCCGMALHEGACRDVKLR